MPGCNGGAKIAAPRAAGFSEDTADEVWREQFGAAISLLSRDSYATAAPLPKRLKIGDRVLYFGPLARLIKSQARARGPLPMNLSQVMGYVDGNRAELTERFGQGSWLAVLPASGGPRVAHHGTKKEVMAFTAGVPRDRAASWVSVEL